MELIKSAKIATHAQAVAAAVAVAIAISPEERAARCARRRSQKRVRMVVQRMQNRRVNWAVLAAAPTRPERPRLLRRRRCLCC
eukprot:6211421-Pleurochrysis_carterae.AAC.2